MQRVLLVIDFKLIIYQTITSTKKKNKCCVIWAMAQITPDDVAQFSPMPDFQQKTHLRKSIVSIFSYSHKNVHETTENKSYTVCHNHSILFWSYFSESNVAKNFFTQRKPQNLM